MDIFISHSSADNDQVKLLVDQFETNGLQVWVDLEEIRLGNPLMPQLRDNIEQCRAYLLIWSKTAAKSRWVTTEWLAAFHQGKPIIPCVLDDTPLPYCMQNAIYIKPKGDWAEDARIIQRNIDDPQSGRNTITPPLKPIRETEQLKAINEIIKKQMEVLYYLQNDNLKSVQKVARASIPQREGDRLMAGALAGWPMDTLIITLKGYHLKNAFQVKHHQAIHAGGFPKDPLIDEAEWCFFEALAIDPTDHAALNGFGNYLFFRRFLPAAEYFTARAIHFCKEKGENCSSYERDLRLIRNQMA